MGILGQHLARAMEWDVGESSTGNVQLGMSLRIDVGEYEGLEYPFYLHFNTNENTERSLRVLRAVGVRGTYDQIMKELGGDAPRLDGFGSRRVQITIAEEKKPDGTVEERIAWVGGGIPLQKRTGAEGRRRIVDAIARLGTNGAAKSTPPAAT